MSMNLHARANGKPLDLWQTPTWLSHAAMIDESGAIRYSVKKKRARRALYIYLQWAEGTCRNLASDIFESHSKEISASIHADDLEVYIL